ncbi:ORF MSV110 hypothetical protein [Melanoplus sanguinipes entomopoxvirus]|uniref:Uncharacterized protein n=1 Tax=Melanoplus sanguinipes entomopoxvirus TaxID=83191 RepID=Q9YVY3_MSEPV|nr:ORF MSV110 hypothetical protein [Melanoplus sanguinipes entomopoxvirus]AAC97804.1 ORF MSV110 hypothetical protein [Melanoplus sanguinipes entomopoxvirus 'O']
MWYIFILVILVNFSVCDINKCVDEYTKELCNIETIKHLTINNNDNITSVLIEYDNKSIIISCDNNDKVKYSRVLNKKLNFNLISTSYFKERCYYSFEVFKISYKPCLFILYIDDIYIFYFIKNSTEIDITPAINKNHEPQELYSYKIISKKIYYALAIALLIILFVIIISTIAYLRTSNVE